MSPGELYTETEDSGVGSLSRLQFWMFLILKIKENTIKNWQNPEECMCTHHVEIITILSIFPSWSIKKKSLNNFIEIFHVAMHFAHLTHFPFSWTILAGGTWSYSVYPKMTHGLWSYLTLPPKFARHASLLLFFSRFLLFSHCSNVSVVFGNK